MPSSVRLLKRAEEPVIHDVGHHVAQVHEFVLSLKRSPLILLPRLHNRFDMRLGVPIPHQNANAPAHRDVHLSESDFRKEGNFTLFIGNAAAAKFKNVGIDDPAEHFKGKKVRATGTVKLYRNRPEIVIEDPNQVVEDK
jgi:hypothetical protein